MRIEIKERPFEAQIPFLKDESRYVAYGGARGGGKSWAIRFKAMVLALKYSGIRILIVRRSYAELKENHIIKLREMIPSDVAKYNEQDKAFTFINGSRLKFGYCANETDVSQYQGVEYDVVFIDEATQLTEMQFRAIDVTIRGVNGFPKRMYITCNPGGVGHAWVKRLFIDRDFLPGENANDYVFYKALVYDNKALMESDSAYVKTLESLDPRLKQAWLYGDWDIFEGRFFPEFRRDIHTIEPFVIPKEWKRYRVFDYGLDCFACYFVAVDYDNVAYVYKEIHESDLIVSEAAKKLLEFSSEEKIERTFAPPDMRNRHKETGKSTEDIFRAHGIVLTIVSNNREMGWLNVKEALKVIKDQQGCQTSRVQIFRNCTNLIKALGEIQTDGKNPNDVASTPHHLTHSVDALRYFFAGTIRKPEKERPRKEYMFESERPKVNPLGQGIRIGVI